VPKGLGTGCNTTRKTARASEIVRLVMVYINLAKRYEKLDKTTKRLEKTSIISEFLKNLNGCFRLFTYYINKEK
jgi:hypothetical protein